jgi:hypothetical protein
MLPSPEDQVTLDAMSTPRVSAAAPVPSSADSAGAVLTLRAGAPPGPPAIDIPRAEAEALFGDDAGAALTALEAGTHPLLRALPASRGGPTPFDFLTDADLARADAAWEAGARYGDDAERELRAIEAGTHPLQQGDPAAP